MLALFVSIEPRTYFSKVNLTDEYFFKGRTKGHYRPRVRALALWAHKGSAVVRYRQYVLFRYRYCLPMDITHIGSDNRNRRCLQHSGLDIPIHGFYRKGFVRGQHLPIYQPKPNPSCLQQQDKRSAGRYLRL